VKPLRPRARRRAPGKRRAVAPRRLIPILAAGAAALLALIAWAVWGPGPASRAQAEGGVVLAPGEGVGAIAGALARAHLIGSAPLFIAAVELSGQAHALKAGEYAFAPAQSLAGVLAKIVHGRTVRRFVTLPEGLTSVAIADLLAADPVLVGPAPIAAEGTLLPETYEVRRGEARGDVEARMSRARDELLGQLWAERAAGLPYRSPRDAVTLASIVERETALPEERPRVAAVFINRLHAGIPLASDPTVIYGLTHGRPLGHGLTVSELARVTPYNTYKLAGLPPTPIANPGRAALAAALKPAKTDDLYFVADGTGGHAFSATYAEHARNVARWRRIERAAKGAGS
jgi:UPF0755 protein